MQVWKDFYILHAVVGFLLLLLVPHRYFMDSLQIYGNWVSLARDVRSCWLLMEIFMGLSMVVLKNM